MSSSATHTYNYSYSSTYDIYSSSNCGYYVRQQHYLEGSGLRSTSPTIEPTSAILSTDVRGDKNSRVSTSFQDTDTAACHTTPSAGLSCWITTGKYGFVNQVYHTNKRICHNARSNGHYYISHAQCGPTSQDSLASWARKPPLTSCSISSISPLTKRKMATPFAAPSFSIQSSICLFSTSQNDQSGKHRHLLVHQRPAQTHRQTHGQRHLHQSLDQLGTSRAFEQCQEPACVAPIPYLRMIL